MSGKRAETLLDALLISDIREDLTKDTELRAGSGRNVHAALRHESQQSDGLENDGFSSCVRTCHEEQVEILA